MIEKHTLNDGRTVYVRHGVAANVKPGDKLVMDGEVRVVEERKFQAPKPGELERRMVIYYGGGLSVSGDEAQSVYHLVKSAPHPTPVTVNDFRVIGVLPFRGKDDHWVVACDRGEEVDRDRYVTWEVKVETTGNGDKINAFWGHYFDDRNEVLKDLIKRAELDRAES